MRIINLIFLLVVTIRLTAQDPDRFFTSRAVLSVENSLASDSMRGRASFTPDIERAADYIESQFRQAGLKTLDGGASYRQPFTLIRTSDQTVSGNLNGLRISPDSIIIFSSAPHLRIDRNSNFKFFGPIKSVQMLRSIASLYFAVKTNCLFYVDTSLAEEFKRLRNATRQQFKSDHFVVLVLTSVGSLYTRCCDNLDDSLIFDQQVRERGKLANVVGILPGKDKAGEYVIFSGHYDHLGIGRPNAKGDSIYNGANDDASGTTAVILLARYFARLHNNLRTLVFAAFTAEEIGEFGSRYFSGQFNPDSVVAMFNIEMIGLPSKWGKNSAFITGYDRTDMGSILGKNLTGSGFAFHPDPYPGENLFYRSDNASLARRGVPAHTISTTQIDIDSTYHTPADEIANLDLENMAAIIRAIAISSKTIVSGKDTPTRVDTSKVN